MNSISSQTGLLSLNASVEAAGAGEAFAQIFEALNEIRGHLPKSRRTSHVHQENRVYCPACIPIRITGGWGSPQTCCPGRTNKSTFEAE